MVWVRAQEIVLEDKDFLERTSNNLVGQAAVLRSIRLAFLVVGLILQAVRFLKALGVLVGLVLFLQEEGGVHREAREALRTYCKTLWTNFSNKEALVCQEVWVPRTRCLRSFPNKAAKSRPEEARVAVLRELHLQAQNQHPPSPSPQWWLWSAPWKTCTMAR